MAWAKGSQMRQSTPSWASLCIERHDRPFDTARCYPCLYGKTLHYRSRWHRWASAGSHIIIPVSELRAPPPFLRPLLPFLRPPLFPKPPPLFLRPPPFPRLLYHASLFLRSARVAPTIARSRTTPRQLSYVDTVERYGTDDASCRTWTPWSDTALMMSPLSYVDTVERYGTIVRYGTVRHSTTVRHGTARYDGTARYGNDDVTVVRGRSGAIRQ
ncbi:hypothetical protein Vretimale_10214 [Volvox reticuliferus]|uniref:Uncharacterized protein n=1 Tax=Volvox reticuliferus TaxID=1737510 RepID=A0A8J4LPL9_9CHLO|nr:hypothetical protein Vretimale_10214 [Volvox reticuliferus]